MLRTGILNGYLWVSVLLGNGIVLNTCHADDGSPPETWRRQKRIVDLHQHIDGRPECFARAVKILDQAGVGIGIDLGSGTVTHSPGELSQFEQVKQVAEATAPGRFLHYMLLDYSGWDDADWSQRAADQVIEGRRLGAAGLKEFKRLGLVLRDGQGKLIHIDDPKLDAVWAKCGELGMPVSIHVADPKAFWEPRDEQNERWSELRDHPNWWFGDRTRYPDRMELLAALSRVMGRHPATTFVAVHFANNAEDLAWVDRELTAHPNMMADVAARIPEMGRHAPEQLHALLVKHQDRIVFGSDFQVNPTRLVLGSAGDAERPTDYDGYVFFQKTWRFFETADRDWVHMTPIQGDWTISSVHLPPDVLRKIYFDNARKLLAASWPQPTLTATHIAEDFAPDGRLDDPPWQNAAPESIEYSLQQVDAVPALSTTVRALWSDKYLYLAYEAPYTKLTMSSTPQRDERIGLWDDDVVEAFIVPNPQQPGDYREIEWAPNGEFLDLSVNPTTKDFAWQSEMESAVQIDEAAGVWRVEVRIPFATLSARVPQVAERWRCNLYRHDVAHHVFLAWNPTLTPTAHTPAQFGWLEFTKSP